jgi:hypothetical protein
MRRQAESQPHQQVASYQQCYQLDTIAARSSETIEPLQQWQGGRQHHRCQHQKPSPGIKQSRQQQVAAG